MTTTNEQLRQYLANNPELEVVDYDNEPLNPLIQQAVNELKSRDWQRVNGPRHPALKADPVVKYGQPVERKHKYNAQATEINSIRFDSKREAQRYTVLKARQAAGEIHALQLQPRFELQPAFKDASGKTVRAIHYVADFQYVEDATGKVIVEDVKGVATAVFQLKRKMFIYKYGRKVELRIVK